MNDLVEVYGPDLSIKSCVLGNNLNLAVIRGFARLDVLAAISAPDVFDREDNPQGTQRDLNSRHALEATAYALESVGVPPDSAPRAFTEVILNARDRSVISVIDHEADREIDFSSLDPIDLGPRIVDLRVNIRQLEFPHPLSDPAISRVDGNHRLSQVDLPDVDSESDYPVIPFAMFVGLSVDQERALFRDINGTQMKMETAHLDTIKLKLQGSELLKTEGGRALWIAQILAEQGHAFEGKVFFGGAKKGAKAATGMVPPIKINALKGAVAATCREMTDVEASIYGVEIDEEGNTLPPDEYKVAQVIELIDLFWKAVASAFPEAWQDRKNFILLQAIGLNAFSRLGADVIQRQFLREGRIGQADFDAVLEHVASRVTLRREEYPGLAGLAGAKEVYRKLSNALNADAVEVTMAKKALEKLVRKPGPLDGI